ELAERAGCRVPRIRERLLARLEATTVQRLERRIVHDDLAPDRDAAGRRALFAAEPEQDGGDRAHVRGHVLAAEAIAAGRGADEHAALVDELDRRAVELRLEDQPRFAAGRPTDPLDEALDLAPLAGRRQADHRRRVFDRREFLARR